jgi:hypothetical protein
VVCPGLLELPNDIYSSNVVIYIAFKVLKIMVMKCFIFWDVMQYSPLKVGDVSEEHVAYIFGIKE